MPNLQDDEIRTGIASAFGKSKDNWRTLWGIAKDAGLPLEVVRAYIDDHPDYFKKSSVMLSGTTSSYTLNVDLEAVSLVDD